MRRETAISVNQWRRGPKRRTEMARKRWAYTRIRDRGRVRRRRPLPKTGWQKPELSRLTQIPGRRITDYVQRGLLPSPEFRGTATRYQRVHLIRLLAIERLMGMGVRRLDEVRRHLNSATLVELEAWLRRMPLRPDVLQALDAQGAPTDGAVGAGAASARVASGHAATAGVAAAGASARTSSSGAVPAASASIDGSDNTQPASASARFPSQSWYRIEVLPGFELALRSDASPLTKRVASRVLAKLERAVSRATEDLAPATNTSP